jgi:hypothetical protein
VIDGRKYVRQPQDANNLIVFGGQQ